MPAQFGSAKIGAMQFGGTPIAEAMFNGQIVFRSGGGWPKTGTWGGGTVPLGDVVQQTFTAPQNGDYTIQWSITYTTVTSSAFASSRIRVNGAGTWTSGPFLSSPGTSTAPSWGTHTRTLTAGDVIQFYSSTENTGCVASIGTWTVNKVG